jgi:hypothetical protein
MAGRDAPSLNETIRSLFVAATREGAPWEMVVAPSLMHAFDALDEGIESKRRVKETVAWLVDRLVAPPTAGPAPDPPRVALTHVFAREYPEAAAAYLRILETSPNDAGARRSASRALYNVACAEALAGGREAALEHLAQAVAAGFGPRETIEKDDDLVSLRGNPRFAEILAKAKPAP